MCKITTKCSVDGCSKNAYQRGYCTRHYDQWYTHGRILERTTRDPNEFIFHEDCVEIKLYNKNCEYIASTYIDLDDYEKVKDYKWNLLKDGYVSSSKVGRLHRFIYPNKEQIKNKGIDHIDRNPLNNRKQNLRPATKSENGYNRPKNKNNQSGYKNIVEYPKYYSVFLNFKGKRPTKSFYFTTYGSKERALEEAIKWRNEMKTLHEKEFVLLDK